MPALVIGPPLRQLVSLHSGLVLTHAPRLDPWVEKTEPGGIPVHREPSGDPGLAMQVDHVYLWVERATGPPTNGVSSRLEPPPDERTLWSSTVPELVTMVVDRAGLAFRGARVAYRVRWEDVTGLQRFRLERGEADRGLRLRIVTEIARFEVFIPNGSISEDGKEMLARFVVRCSAGRPHPTSTVERGWLRRRLVNAKRLLLGDLRSTVRRGVVLVVVVTAVFAVLDLSLATAGGDNNALAQAATVGLTPGNVGPGAVAVRGGADAVPLLDRPASIGQVSTFGECLGTTTGQAEELVGAGVLPPGVESQPLPVKVPADRQSPLAGGNAASIVTPATIVSSVTAMSELRHDLRRSRFASCWSSLVFESQLLELRSRVGADVQVAAHGTVPIELGPSRATPVSVAAWRTSATVTASGRSWPLEFDAVFVSSRSILSELFVVTGGNQPPDLRRMAAMVSTRVGAAQSRLVGRLEVHPQP